MGPVCLFGDFNSRCADLNDYIKGVDNLSDREVVDFQVNKYGHILLDFLMNSNFCILNGRNSIKNDFTVYLRKVICCGLLFCQPF